MVKEFFTKRLCSKISQYERCSANSYFKCQWQGSSSGVSKAYVAYRWVHLLLVLTIILLSVVEYGKSTQNIIYYLKWPVYLTNWALIAVLGQAVIAVWVVTSAASYTPLVPSATNTPEQPSNAKQGAVADSRLRLSIKCYSIMHATAIVVALGVTFVYWTFIYNPEIHDLDLVNYLVHGANSVIMVVDFLLVGHPLKLAHSVYPLSFIFIYTIFTYFYYQFGGTDRKGNTYIYKVMDWKYPINCIAFSIAGHILVCIIYALLWLMCLAKRKLYMTLRISSFKATANEFQAAHSVSLV